MTGIFTAKELEELRETAQLTLAATVEDIEVNGRAEVYKSLFAKRLFYDVLTMELERADLAQAATFNVEVKVSPINNQNHV